MTPKKIVLLSTHILVLSQCKSKKFDVDLIIPLNVAMVEEVRVEGFSNCFEIVDISRKRRVLFSVATTLDVMIWVEGIQSESSKIRFGTVAS